MEARGHGPSIPNRGILVHNCDKSLRDYYKVSWEGDFRLPCPPFPSALNPELTTHMWSTCSITEFHPQHLTELLVELGDGAPVPVPNLHTGTFDLPTTKE